MIEINRSQILSFENKNKIEMLKLIAKGRVIYKGEWKQMITKETRQMSFEEIKPKRKKRYVKVIAKRRCEYTGKTVAEYEITVEGIKQRYMKHIPRID